MVNAWKAFFRLLVNDNAIYHLLESETTFCDFSEFVAVGLVSMAMEK